MSGRQLLSTRDLIAQGKLIINDGYRAKNIELGSSGIPFIRVGNLLNDGFQFEDADHFPVENLSRVGIKISQPGDVVLTTKGTVGRFAFIREDTQQFVYSPQISFWRVIDKQTLEPRFLYYWMQGREFQIQCSQVKGQTDMADYVSLLEQRQMQITLPPLPTQQRIAEILGRLDDKIEVNRRINRTLEAMAQALFRHHFVEFGPYQAELVENEAGLIPRGWEASTIGSICDVISGGTPKTSVLEYWDGDIFWATPTDMTALSAPVIFDTARKITRLGLEQSSARLLPTGSVLVTSRATLGFAAITHVPITTNQGFKSMVCGPRVSNYYMLLYIQHNQEALVSNANGSTFLEISGTNFKALPVVVPPGEIMARFEATVKPFYEQIYLNELENRKLAEIRDYLLPRLLSGQVEAF